MSSVDNVSLGVTLMLIESVMPQPVILHPDFFRWVLVYGCGGAAVLGLLLNQILWPMKIGQR